jgi:uncharacterized protein
MQGRSAEALGQKGSLMQDMMAPLDTEILRSTVGSTAHGLALPGTDDLDQMGVCVERLDQAMGLGEPFEQLIYRTATERTGKHDARSEPGDLDLTVFSLRKYLRLALKGNPTVLIPLFSTGPALVHATAEGRALQGLAPSIVSQRAIGSFLGYLTAQKERLLGQRGMKVSRPELIRLHGYDTKFAMHALRLGHQGVELATTGRISLPMPAASREVCLDVRMGRLPLVAVVKEIEHVEGQLHELKSGGSVLSPEPETARVAAWMLRTYTAAWDVDRRSYR